MYATKQAEVELQTQYEKLQALKEVRTALGAVAALQLCFTYQSCMLMATVVVLWGSSPGSAGMLRLL